MTLTLCGMGDRLASAATVVSVYWRLLGSFGPFTELNRLYGMDYKFDEFRFVVIFLNGFVHRWRGFRFR